MSYTTLSTLLITYGALLYIWNKKTTSRLDEPVTSTIRNIHYLLAIIVLISAATKWIDNLSFSGQWTTRIVIIGFLLTGFLIHPITNWTNNKGFERLYFRLFAFVPSFLGILLLIPFTGALIFSITIGQLMQPVYKVYFEDNNLRVQSSYLGPLWPPGVFVYKKMGVLEKQIVDRPISDLLIDSVAVKYQEAKTLLIFYSADHKTDTLMLKNID